VSIGVAACPEHADSERTLYAASDKALYVAKNEGRDRIAVAPRLQEELPAVEHRGK
jgi:GGDEF domain-containing protein